MQLILAIDRDGSKAISNFRSGVDMWKAAAMWGLGAALMSWPATAQVIVTPKVAATALHCYHPSGRYEAYVVLQSPWIEGPQFGAKVSTLFEVDFNGALSGRPYQMQVAVLGRNGFWRYVVHADNAPFAPNPNCVLSQWQPGR